MHSLLEQQLNYEYIVTPAAVNELVLPTLATAEKISLDIETTDLYSTKGCVRLIQIGVSDHDHGHVEQVRSADPASKQYVVDAFRVDVTPVVEALHAVPTLMIQNAAFEAEWLHFHYGWEFDLSKIFDTCVASWALNEKPANLGAIVQRRLGFPLPKGEQLSDWSQPELREEQLKYAALDAAVLPLLASGLRIDLESRGLTSKYEADLREWVAKSHSKHPAAARGRAHEEEKLREKIIAVLGAVENPATLEKYYALTWQRVLRREHRDAVRAAYEDRKAALTMP